MNMVVSAIIEEEMVVVVVAISVEQQPTEFLESMLIHQIYIIGYQAHF